MDDIRCKAMTITRTLVPLLIKTEVSKLSFTFTYDDKHRVLRGLRINAGPTHTHTVHRNFYWERYFQHARRRDRSHGKTMA